MMKGEEKPQQEEDYDQERGEYERRVGDPAVTLATLSSFWHYEIQFLLLADFCSLVGLVMLVVAVATEHWIVIDYTPHHGNLTGVASDHRVQGFMGLWRTCRTSKSTKEKHCALTELFMTEDHLTHDPAVDITLLNYSRSEVAFAIISILLMTIVATFDSYTFKYPRYILKRLCAFLHLMAAASTLVCIEVFINGVAYEKSHAPLRHPQHALWSYGYSFILVWFSIVLHCVSFAVYVAYGRKRRLRVSHAVAKEDAPLNLGRAA